MCTLGGVRVESRWEEVTVPHGEPGDDRRGGVEGAGGGCVYNCGWFAWLYGRNQHNVVKTLKQNLNNYQEKKIETGLDASFHFTDVADNVTFSDHY